MQLINTKTVKDSAPSAIPAVIYIEKRTKNPMALYFPRTVCKLMKLKKTDRVCFLNDGNEWNAFRTDDKDGFPFYPERGGRYGLVIYSAGLCRMLAKTGFREFKIEGSGYRQQGEYVYKLIPFKRK